MKTQILLAFITCISSIAIAQTTLPYSAHFDNVTEQGTWKQYKLGQETGLSYWEYEKINNVTDSFALVHYYPVGGTQTTDNWMVSPELDMTKGAIIDSMFYLMKGFGGGNPQPADTIALYYIEGNRDPSLATKKEIVYDYLRTDFKLDNIWYSKSALKIPYKAKSGYLAFRYKTVINWLDIKVDNIQVSPQKTTEEPKDSNKTAINLQEINRNSAVSLYPNPSNDNVKFTGNVSELDVSIFDFTGKLMLQQTVFSNEELSIEILPIGVYVVEIVSGKIRQRMKLVVD